MSGATFTTNIPVERRMTDIFIVMLVISLLLHITAGLFVLLPGRGTVTQSGALFVDMKSLSLPAQAAPIAASEPVEPSSPEQPLAEPIEESMPEVAKLESAVAESLRVSAKEPETIHQSAIGLGMLSGRFTSFSEGETLKDEIRVYYFELMRRINEYWWRNGAGKGAFDAPVSVNLLISREGKIIACDFFQSSGSREQDQIMIEAIKAAQPLPPLPANFPQNTFNAPIRFVPPLRLMFPFGSKRAAAPH
ncbi:MAG: TonB family protein [Geobacteraceae bacterium]|nr:TonB family protein [Geobacteraceae bacterium]